MLNTNKYLNLICKTRLDSGERKDSEEKLDSDKILGLEYFIEKIDSGSVERFRKILIQEQKINTGAEDGIRNRRWIQEQKMDSKT